MNFRRLKLLSFGIALLCLLRAYSAVADSGSAEVYSATEKSGDEVADDSSQDDAGRPEIRLTRPDEAASRTAKEDQGYDQVPGVEKFLIQQQAQQQAENTITVPQKMDRKIAGAESAPPSAGSTPTRLEAEPMEPQAYTPSDARARQSELHSETIAPPGLKSEPRFETRVDPPVPRAPGSAGVQEISLIVSDYGYFPQRIFVTQNVPVKIYLSTPSKVTMCFMQDNWGLKKGITPGKVEEITFTPDQAGDYRFYCPVKSIEGKLTVREAPMADQPSRNVASEDKTRGHASEPPPRNAPKNSNELRQLIED